MVKKIDSNVKADIILDRINWLISMWRMGRLRNKIKSGLKFNNERNLAGFDIKTKSIKSREFFKKIIR